MDNRATTTRRQVLSRSLSLGGLGAAGSTIGSLLSSEQSHAAPEAATDADLLGDVLAIELLAGAVYERVSQSGLLSARGQRLAGQLLLHERAHARVLALELGKLGGAVPASPAGADAIDKALADHHVSRSVAKLGSERDCVALLMDVEAMAEGAHYVAMSKLGAPRLLRLSAEIMANEAQHTTLLSDLIHPGDVGMAVPYAFVEGTQ